MTGTIARLAPMAGDALGWWIGELRDLVPLRIRERRLRQVDADIHLARDAWIIRHRSGTLSTIEPGDGAALADAAAVIRGRRRQGRVSLVVPLSRCFTRRTDLPRRMLGRATAILASELELAMPFPPGSVHWDWYVEAAAAEPGIVTVAQVVLKRRDTEGLVSALAACGVTLASIAVEDTTTRRRLPIDLLRLEDMADATLARSRGGRRILAMACVAAMLAIVPAAFSRQNTTLVELDGAIADATDAVALRPGLPRAVLQRLGDALTVKRVMPTTAMLDALATTLPPDSRIDRIVVDNDVVTIGGRTTALHNLERSFANARFFTAGHNTAPPDAAGDGRPFTLRLKRKLGPADMPG